MVRADGTRWLKVVEQEYALGDPSPVRDLGGNFNLNLLITSARGELVVRVTPDWVSPERLTAVRDVREYLRGCGWPVPPVVRTGSGASWIAVDERLVEVEQYIEPRGARMNSWAAAGAGLGWLARLHDDLRQLPYSKAAAEPPMANYLEPEVDLSEVVAEIRAWGLSAQEERYVAAAERIAAEEMYALPGQLVHGDFWDGNVWLDGDRITLLLDLDFLGQRPRIDDLALTLFLLTDHLGIDVTRLRQLVDQYDAALGTPLSPEERAALPLAIVRAPLTFLRDLTYLGPSSRAELNQLRGPQYERGVRLLDTPQWRSAFE